MGVGIAVATGLVVGGATLLVPSRVNAGDRLSLALACVVVSSVSPLQDHARRMLHLAYDSWGAAQVSVVQCLVAVTLGGAVVLTGTGSSPWVPFTVLSVANMASLSVAIHRARGPGPTAAVSGVDVALRSSLRFGAVLGVSTFVTFGSAFCATAFVVAEAGSASAGEAEGARLLAQPITLVAVGLLSVLRPEIMQSVTRGDMPRLRRLIVRFLLGMAALTAVWAGVAWRPWSFSPLPMVAPTAYAVSGLVLLTVPAQVLEYVVGFGGLVSLAVGRIRQLVLASSLTAIAGLIVCGLLARHGAWALALSTMTGGALLVTYCLLRTVGPRRWSLVRTVAD